MASHATDSDDGRPGFDIVQALAKHGMSLPTGDGNSTLSTLSSLYPKQVITSASGTEAWRKQLFSALQQSAKPSLVFQPASAKEVAIALLFCRKAQVKFAVKSGGHAAMKGASNADGGVTIDLKNLNGVELNDDKSIARIGPGNKWSHVFEVLAKDGLAVAGGRAGDVGVGGYTLGGGISFFASARGWACDNVRNYELVTANGEILDVNSQSYPDLYWALRGGGSNFGIVTRFDYETFPQGDIYAGNILYDYVHKDAVVRAFTGLAHDSDPKSATWLSIAYHEGKRLLIALAMYADPTPDFAARRAYTEIPALYGTHKVRSMADMLSEIMTQQVVDHRQNYYNHTFKFDADFVSWLVELYYTEMEPFSGADRYESKQAMVIVMQYYTKESIALMRREGGNCLPLKEDDAPYLNLLAPTAWIHEKDDDIVLGLVRKIMGAAVEEGKRRGLFVDYIYMNYGSAYQDVLKGYGQESYDRLKEVASKYDPERVFQTLMPGYFKFGGSPA